MVSEGRTEAGLEVDESHEVFLRPAGITVVPAGETGEAEPVPPALGDGSSNGQVEDDDKARKAAGRKAPPTLEELPARPHRPGVACGPGGGKATPQAGRGRPCPAAVSSGANPGPPPAESPASAMFRAG